MSLSILLRDGNHAGSENSATNRFALQADRFSVTMTKTPIQIPIPQSRPEIIDLGVVRPNISVSGVIDTVGLPNSADATTNHMQELTYTLYNTPNTTNYSAKKYYVPYKNVLEDFVYYVHFSSSDTPIQIEVLGQDPAAGKYHTMPTGADHTGGAIYNVAIQNASFNLSAGKENRYDYSLSFIATTRLDQHSSASAITYDQTNYSYTRGVNNEGMAGGRDGAGLADI